MNPPQSSDQRSDSPEYLKRKVFFDQLITVYGRKPVLEMLDESTELRDKLESNTHYFRKGMQQAGFDVEEGDHPIVPVMLGDANIAQDMSKKLLERGIYAIGFFFPVVPKGKARIRTQISAAHTENDLDKAIKAFAETRDELIVNA